MNGQQLTNSSNSATGTPSSSYPGSLSSQSSRDTSPATQPRKPLPESFNHVIGAQPNHWPSKGGGDQQHSSNSSPAPTPPAATLHQAKPQVQGLRNSIAQPVTAQPNQPRPFSNHQVSTQQPMHNFALPTSLSQPFPPSSQPSLPASQSNHITQPSGLSNPTRSPNHLPYSTAQNVQPLEQPRPAQSPLQNSSYHLQKQSGNFPPQPNQFQQQSVPFQPQSTQFQNMPAAGQGHQIPSQPPNLMPLSQSRLPQSPNQLVQPTNQIPPQNKFSQPTSQLSQVPNQTKPPLNPNQLPQQPLHVAPPQSRPIQPSNQVVQNSNKFSQPQSQFSRHPNQLPQPSGQMPQPPNQMPQPPNQMSQPPNQMPQPPNHYSQPPNHYSQPPSQYGQQVPNQMPPAQPLQQMNVSGPAYQTQYPNQGYPQSQEASNQFNKRYPQMPGYQHQPGSVDGLTPNMAGMSVQQGFNKIWGMDTVDLLKSRDLLPKEKIEPPHIRLQHELYESANCSPEIFRCTLTKIPETKSLLDKSRLPLGVLIHPFKDLNQLSVIQCTVIVRCRMCRTYINPFVYFVDNKRWKCNLCFRVNELPDEFQFDPMTKTYGDPSRRPEIKSATIEFIAPSEYMVRPPQPAVYVYLLDVSRLACECGYLDAVCRTLLAELDNVPGDARTSIAFITFDSAVHFFSLAEGHGQPHQMTVVDIEDMFLPTPDNLLVNLNDCRDLVKDLLEKLPARYKESYDTHSALGPALQAAYKLLAPTGGRVTVFQSCLPNVGPGALTVREDPATRAGDNPPHLNPSTDFYKKLALDCSGQQIAVDLFLVNSQYLDLATLSGVSRFSGGCMFHIPLYRSDKPIQVETLERMFQRYLTRKIGFESVMRMRCTRGLAIHTFHGNFFVRSTDLLSLPNANPDAGFGMQVTIDESLTDVQNVCFQAALLYTSSKGERRIRVHTLCLPVASNLADILHSADQQCIVGLLAKMAADRAVQSSLSDAREAFINVVGDVLSAYKLTQTGNTVGCMLAPANLKLLPLYILALLKNVAFRVGQSTRLDDRVFAMCQMKSLPLSILMQSVYPHLYPLLNIEHQPEISVDEHTVAQLPLLQLSAERIDSLGMFLMDIGSSMLIYVGHNLNPPICQAVFDVRQFSEIPPELYSLPELDNPISQALRNFISYLQNEKPYPAPLQVIRDDSPYRTKFLEKLIEDKNESGTSYYEFLQRVKTLIK